MSPGARCPDPLIGDVDDEYLTGRLRFGKAQYGLLALLVSLVGLIAAIGYQSSLVVSEQTEALNDQLQLVSANMVSLERQVLTHALIIDRWAEGLASDEDVEVTRALVERQHRISANEAEADPDLAQEMAELTAELKVVDGLVARGRPVAGSEDHLVLNAAVDEMAGSVKRLFDRTEAQNFTLVHSLEDGLGSLRRTEWIVAGLIVLLVVALMASLRRMLRANYESARKVLGREQSRYLTARAEQVRVEGRYREVVDEVRDVVFRVDHRGRWTLLNRAWETLTCIPVDAALGEVAADVWHPADQSRVAATITELIDSRRTQAVEEVRLVRADEVERTVVITARATTDDATGGVYVAGTINDVTAQVRAKQLAAAQTEILEMVALDAPLVSVLTRIVELISPHAPAAEFRFVTDLTGVDVAAEGSLPLTDLSRGERIGVLEWTAPNGIDHDEEFDGVVVLAAQLGALAIDRQLAADRVAHEASHDALTGLPNRALLADRIEMAVERAARNDSGVAIMFLDIDRFKTINDSLGHNAGDRLLLELAKRITGVVRNADTVARFGGDEFVVLLEGVEGPGQVCRVAEAILAAVAEPVVVDTHRVAVTTSIGIVLGEGDALVEDLIKNADVAMYRAKQSGRARYELFDAGMQEWATHRHASELAVQGALDRGEMEVWYQPLVHLESGRLKGYEALVRWRRPGFGVVAPGEFIEMVEELGMINLIGSWVLETAAHQLAVWQETAPELILSVNVSSREIVRSDYVEGVAAAIERSGVKAESLVLEITESVLVEDTQTAQLCLQGLKNLGVRLAIDDFGTGYSSLQYLRRLSVDILKIDRAFVSSTSAELHDPTIVASITELGHAFGLEVVAEGIETEEQRQALVALGVDSGQGYHFGRPSPPAERVVVDRVER